MKPKIVTEWLKALRNMFESDPMPQPPALEQEKVPATIILPTENKTETELRELVGEISRQLRDSRERERRAWARVMEINGQWVIAAKEDEIRRERARRAFFTMREFIMNPWEPEPDGMLMRIDTGKD